MNSGIVRFSIALGLLGLSAPPTVLSLGPRLEARFLPATTVGICKERVTGTRLYFSFCGDKKRVCPLDSLPFHWRYDHTVEATVVRFTTTGEIYNPQTLIARGAFEYGEFYVDIPEPAYGLPEAEFGGVTFHDCGGLWLIPHEFTVKIMPKRDGSGKLSMAVARK